MALRERMPIRILFVDDEPDLELLIRQKYRKQIRRKEVDLSFASNGQEALQAVDAAPQEFDLIITDINMPVMNGIELLGELAERELHTPVLVLSAYGDMTNIRHAMNRGAFDFLTKPIDFSDLAITQQKALTHLDSVRERDRLQHEQARLKERAVFVRETFGRYLSDSVVETLLDEPEGLRLGGEKREISILMSDLRGFTPLCERLAPETVVSVLNRYFSVMIDIILAHGGTIDELLGDAILVIFGAPLSQPDHADQAVRCAIAMQRAMESVNNDNAAASLPQLEMGIAINTGEAVIGNIGSPRRAKYGVVGSHVNLTARIEGLTVGRQVLVSEETRRACTLPLWIDDELTINAKGFEAPVVVHEVRGIEGQPDLMLPRLEPALVSISPLPVRVSPAQSGTSAAAVHRGHLTRVSAHHCELTTAAPLDVDLRASLLLRIGDAESVATVHGKVVQKLGDDTLLLRFTSVPPEAAQKLGALSPSLNQAQTLMSSARDTLVVDDPTLAQLAAGDRAPTETSRGTAPEPAANYRGPPRPDSAATHNHLATLGLMVAGVAHDIRNPLGFIISFAQISQELADEVAEAVGPHLPADIAEEVRDTFDDVRDNLVKIGTHGTRANNLVQSVMDTVRGHRTAATQIDLNRVIERHLELFEYSLRRAHPDLQLELEREFQPETGLVHIATQDVSRIVLNLVQNACDAAQAKSPQMRAGEVPRVVVKTRGDADALEVSVFDNGIGISPELEPAIFDPLFTTKGATDGLGLGLAIVRQIVDSAGGTIAVKSTPGENTEFTVRLPRSGTASG